MLPVWFVFNFCGKEVTLKRLIDMRTNEEEKEYIEKCFDTYQNGGMLWLIERLDTNEFCYKQMEMWQSNKPETWRDTFLWSKDISFFHVFFLTKEDAERELQENMFMRFTEGGCRCCGHGSTKIPIAITEHEFVRMGKI